MKFSATVAALSATLFACSANAADISHDIKLEAQVDPFCSLGQQVSFMNGAGSGFQNADTAESTFKIDVVEGVAQETEGVISLNSFRCNTKTHVSISPSRLLKNTTAPAGQGNLTKEIPYRVAFESGSIAPDPDSPFPDDIFLVPSTSPIPISLNIRVEPNGLVLAAGVYEDTLTVTFSPEM